MYIFLSFVKGNYENEINDDGDDKIYNTDNDNDIRNCNSSERITVIIKIIVIARSYTSPQTARGSRREQRDATRLLARTLQVGP